jgi:hypothetical protein
MYQWISITTLPLSHSNGDCQLYIWCEAFRERERTRHNPRLEVELLYEAPFDEEVGLNFQSPLISGQELVAAHGTRDMPIFSLEFARPNEAELGAGGPAIRSQHRINQEINTIVRYVESIQQK